MNEIVSVIVPVYNVERYLWQCIQSILLQSYDNLEIILVDDGSPDNCGKMCDEFAATDIRIKVIHKQNGGLSDARNVGIEMATGKYITFVDSDDYIMPDMINRLLNVAKNENVDIVQCGYRRTKNNFYTEKSFGQVTNSKYIVYSDNKMTAYLKDCIITTVTWGKIYKTSLFDKIRFPKGRLHEDVFTTYKIIHEAHTVAIIDYVGYIYRINENSITAAPFSLKKMDSIYGKLKQADFIHKNYPMLIEYANVEIIYACNQCLVQMAKGKYQGIKELGLLQKLYKKYGKFYIRNNVSFGGKIIVVLAMINVSLAEFILTLGYRRIG